MEDGVRLIMTVKRGNSTKCKLSHDRTNGDTTQAIVSQLLFESREFFSE